MVFLPLQLGWAAVSGYCQHETGAAANHFGHHEHVHQGGDDDGDGGKASGGDFDCGFCHAASVTALTGGVLTPPLDMMSSAATPPRVFLLSVHPIEPERPKWLFPA